MRATLTLLTVSALGCSSGATTPPPGEPSPPSRPITSCTVGRDIALGSGEAGSPAIASSGGLFTVVWSDGERGFLSVVDRDGKVVHDEEIAPSSTKAKITPSVAARTDGGTWVTWEEVAGGVGTVMAQRFDDGGAPVSTALTLATTGSTEARPDVTATKDGALVAWSDAQGAVVAEVKNDAITAQIPLPDGAQPTVAGSADGAGIAWTAGTQIGFLKAATPMRSDQRPTLFRTGPGKPNLPRIAASPGGGYAVVWEDQREGVEGESVFLSQVGKDGQVGAQIAISPPGGSADCPDVTFVGDRAAVVYYQFRDGPPSVYLSLVDPAQGPVGAEVEIAVHGGARYPRVVWGGDGQLAIAYAERRGPAHLALLTCE